VITATTAIARINMALIMRSFCIAHPILSSVITKMQANPQRLVRKFCANKMIGATPMDFSAA